ncbi:MAG TPA: hypothetical protein VJ372_08370 [Pyrinomonadaceae bacterium]|jgi:hypothetical protein|nr:hypothetical protein [Pyrinomonadaceae bacterium]
MRLHLAFLILAELGSASLTEPAACSALSREVGHAIGNIQTVQDEKGSRTAAQKKIDSQLLYALKQKRGETKGVPTEPIDIELDQKGRALVDITAKVTPQVESQIRKLGGAIMSKDELNHTIRARLALAKLEALASVKDVRFIAPAAQPGFNRARPN